MDARRNPVDVYRTMYWADQMVRKTGWSPEVAEAKLIEATPPESAGTEPTGTEKSNLFRKYLKGQRAVDLNVQRHRHRSYVLAGERLAPGTFWDFNHATFALLDELFYRQSSEIASAKFCRRMRAETQHALHLTAPGLNNGWPLLGGPAPDEQEFSLFSRLKRVRYQMLKLPQLAVSKFFGYSSLRRRLFRRLGNISEELEFVRCPPSMDDFGLALALYLEAIELDDVVRAVEAEGALLACLTCLKAIPGLAACEGGISTLVLRALEESSKERGFDVNELYAFSELDLRSRGSTDFVAIFSNRTELEREVLPLDASVSPEEEALSRLYHEQFSRELRPHGRVMNSIEVEAAAGSVY